MCGWEIVERDAELESLARAFDAARESAGSLSVIDGAAGIGKSRLLSELSTLPQSAGFSLLYARGSELEQELPFGVVRQLMEPALHSERHGRTDEWLNGAAAPARHVLGQIGSRIENEGESATLNGLVRLVANMCRAHPLALIMDDMQWADISSLRFVLQLLPELEDLPLALVAARRPSEPISETRLLDLVDSSAALRLSLSPLSHAATLKILRRRLGKSDPNFLRSCYEATTGNPLYLRELIRGVASENIDPSLANSARVFEIGPRSIVRWVARRLSHLPVTITKFARAASMFSSHVDLAIVASLAEISPAEALEATRTLVRMEIIRTTSVPLHGTGHIEFVHPLIRVAVYENQSYAERADAHSRAANILAQSGADSQQIAAHLLLTSATGDPAQMQLLQTAVSDALEQGAPESALKYLRRCLLEPVRNEGERLELLESLGHVALRVDLEAAVASLYQAYELASTPGDQSRIGYSLGVALLYSSRNHEARKILERSLSRVPPGESELQQKILAYLLNIAAVEPTCQDIVGKYEHSWGIPPDSNTGGKLLDCIISFHDMVRCRRAGIERAIRGMSDGVLSRYAIGDSPQVCGWITLLAADAEQTEDILDACVEQGERHGALRDLGPAYMFRGRNRFQRGDLREAETDLRRSVQAIETAGATIGVPIAGAYLADTLMEQGRLKEASSVLDWAGIPATTSGPVYWLLESRARLLRLNGNYEAALQAAIICGDRAAQHDISNPAVLAWRSEAALSLYSLSRSKEARAYADEEIFFARKWAVPRPLGRALRVGGLVSGPQGLHMLEEGMEILKGSPARLEYAKALSDLGSAQRRSGRRGAAKEHLQAALELARLIGAKPLADQISIELSIAGVRPHKRYHSGVEALTPSERRIVELAAEGSTNRQIAQALFVSAKTVEVHLSSSYRKLGVTSRSELARCLA
ncbi:AAA family ATPase [Streptomyces sp. NPDC091267]|uniref:ATP-binding protein n=1 Tax=Streptomyces sp. NPDC091267 TaxID=3155195 RepID=UPI003421439A